MKLNIVLFTLILLTASLVFSDIGNMKAEAGLYDYWWELPLDDNTEWYEGKLFNIEGSYETYSNVKILRIIALSSSNVFMVFERNGYILYIPSNKIIKMYEVK